MQGMAGYSRGVGGTSPHPAKKPEGPPPPPLMLIVSTRSSIGLDNHQRDIVELGLRAAESENGADDLIHDLLRG